ncbi:MAG: competence type IV pilus minor pilin ComGF [Lysinibacillus sp.]
MNEKGYTLIESLFQLVVFIIFSNIFILMMYWYAQSEATLFSKEHLAWESFVNDMNSYLVDVEALQLLASDKGIRFLKNTDIIDIEQSSDVIRKQVRDEGHEPMLFRVKKCRMKYENDEVTIVVEFNNGLKKERTFYVPITEK